MAINIQSLFSDIIETPAQRQQRQMAEGVMQGRELTRGITSPLVPTALASAIAMRQPQAQDRLRRSVGGMLGIDTRSDSERVQEILSGVNPADEKSLIQAADLVGQMGMGAQAAQMRQMAADVVRQREADKRAQMNFAMDQALGAERLTASVESRERNQQAYEVNAIRNQNLVRYAQSLVQGNPELSATLANFDGETAIKIANEYNKEPDRNIFLEEITTEDNERKLVMFDRNDPDFRRDIETLAPEEEQVEIRPLTSSERETYQIQLNSVDEMKKLREGAFFGLFREVDDAVIYDRLAKIRTENPDKTPREHVEMLAEQINQELNESEDAGVEEAQEIANQLDGPATVTDIADIEMLAEEAAAARQAASQNRR